MLPSDNMITWYDLHMSTQWCMNCLGVIWLTHPSWICRTAMNLLCCSTWRSSWNFGHQEISLSYLTIDQRLLKRWTWFSRLFFSIHGYSHEIKWMNDGDKSRVLLKSTHPSQKFTGWVPRCFFRVNVAAPKSSWESEMVSLKKRRDAKNIYMQTMTWCF